MSQKSQPTFDFEKLHWAKGRIVAGVDEVGRGPLAGPVFAAAVVFPRQTLPETLVGVNDSKQLTHKQRQKMGEVIQTEALGYALGFATVAEIDRYNIRQATKLAMLRALIEVAKCASLPAGRHGFGHVLTDAMEITENDATDFDLLGAWRAMPLLTPIIGGDGKSLSIAAASIIAKLARDAHMLDLHDAYPMYVFSSNKGYGTKVHIAALHEHGPTKHHRRSFEPVKSMVG